MSHKKDKKSSYKNLELNDEELKKASGGIRMGGRTYNKASVGNELSNGPVKVEIKV